jgi:hypothetical protein
MEPDLYVDSPTFDAAVRRLAMVSGRSFEAELSNQARLFVEDVIKVTPPFHAGKGQQSGAAKKAGENSVDRNLGRIFAEVDLVGSRRVTHLFGRTDVPGLPYVVPARERATDVEGIYRQAKAGARSASKFRFSRQLNYVDRRKVQAIRKREKARIGWLAGGWNKAAQRMGSSAAAWVRRHGSAPGQVEVMMGGGREWLVIRITNAVPYATKVGGIEKRVAFALRKREDAMKRNYERIMRELRMGR